VFYGESIVRTIFGIESRFRIFGLNFWSVINGGGWGPGLAKILVRDASPGCGLANFVCHNRKKYYEQFRMSAFKQVSWQPLKFTNGDQ
jgi:hypothetical protein